MPELRPLQPRAPRRHTLSVMIIAFNEADRIEPCLQSVAGWADEIVLLDSGSRDATVEIARRYTDRVYVTDWPGFGPQFQRALERTHGEFVFALDADERLTPALREEIDRVLSVEQPPEAAWQLRWELWFLGGVVRHGRFESPQTKLYRRAGLSFRPLQVHPAPLLPPGPIGQLSSRLEHHSFRNLRHAYDKYSDYAWLIARQKYEAGKRSSMLRAIARGWWEFVLQFLLRGMFLEGARGYQLSRVLSHYAYLKYAYLASFRLQPPDR